MIRLRQLACAATIVVSTTGLAMAQQPGNNPNNQGNNPNNPGNKPNNQDVNRPGTVQVRTTFGAINQTPWFGDPAVRKQLRLNDDQFNRLNTVYGQHWKTYNTGYGQLADLNEQERARRAQELSGTFYRDFGRASNEILQPDQRQRFNQIAWQYRGYDAFNDPMIREQLRLNDQQLDQLRRHGLEYTTRMGQISPDATGDRSNNQLNELQKNRDERINSVLNEEQRRKWRELAGDTYNFTFPTPASNREERNRDRDG